MNQAVLGAQPEPPPITSVAVGITRGHLMHRRPTTDIAPAKLARDGQNSAFGACRLENRMIDGNAREFFIFAGDHRAKFWSRACQRFAASSIGNLRKGTVNCRL